MKTSNPASAIRTAALVLAAGTALSAAGCNKFHSTRTTDAKSDPSQCASTPGMTGTSRMTPGSSGTAGGMTNCQQVMTVSTEVTVEPSPDQTANIGAGMMMPNAARGFAPTASMTHAMPNTMDPMPRRPGRMDPFWIEANAEADRAVWAGDSNGVHMTMDPIGPTAFANAPTPTTEVDDGAEGLMHVTFAPEGADFDPCVSREGSYMVYASTQHCPTANIYMKTMTGRSITQLTSDPAQEIMPSISPDGQRIAFTSNRNGNWDIFVMSSTGGQAVQITGDTSQELHPTWSPDGKRICFCRLGQISNRWELWVSEVNNTSSAEFIGFGMFPQWCPKAGMGLDGRDRVLFQRSRERGGRAFSIWTIDYRPGDTSSPTEISASQTAALINATWSPDGSRIVFATIDNPQSPSAAMNATSAYPSVASDLWMSNIDGSGRVNLTSGRFMNLMPWWAADGRIYFVSDRTGLPNIWSIGTDKAIQAATGTRPVRTAGHDVANVPDQHEAPAEQEH